MSKDIGWQKLTFTKIGVAAALTPDAPDAAWQIDIEDAEEILLIYDTTAVAHTSANWDLNVFLGFFLGADFKTGTLTWLTDASLLNDGLGDAKVLRIRVDDVLGNHLSAQRLKLTADCNVGDLLADVYVWVRKQRV